MPTASVAGDMQATAAADMTTAGTAVIVRQVFFIGAARIITETLRSAAAALEDPAAAERDRGPVSDTRVAGRR